MVLSLLAGVLVTYTVAKCSTYLFRHVNEPVLRRHGEICRIVELLRDKPIICDEWASSYWGGGSKNASWKDGDY